MLALANGCLLKSLAPLLVMGFGLGACMSRDYQRSDHWDGKEFFNPWLERGLDKSLTEVLRWKLGSSPKAWPEWVDNASSFDESPPNERQLKTTFINHASFLIQTAQASFLTDPIYSERASPVSFAGPKRHRAPGVPWEKLKNIDLVLISHNHYDHLDEKTIKSLEASFHPQFLVPLGVETLLQSWGIRNVRALDWWESATHKGLVIHFSPAQHWSSRSLGDRNQTLWGSFMIDIPAISKRVYFAGDSGYGPHFVEIKRRLGSPDLALLPIGAYEPRWFMQAQHMNPEEALKAMLDLNATRALGMHYNTFALADEGIDDPARELKLALEQQKRPSESFLPAIEGRSYWEGR